MLGRLTAPRREPIGGSKTPGSRPLPDDPHALEQLEPLERDGQSREEYGERRQLLDVPQNFELLVHGLSLLSLERGKLAERYLSGESRSETVRPLARLGRFAA